MYVACTSQGTGDPDGLSFFVVVCSFLVLSFLCKKEKYKKYKSFGQLVLLANLALVKLNETQH